MRWIAAGMFVFATSLSLAVASYGQIITAQPAQPVRPLNSSPPYVPNGPAYVQPPYSVGYQPNPAVYATPAYGQPAAALSSLATSPEANTIRGWYRDYLGRDVGQDLPALVNLLRGGMSPTDLQATILGSDEFYSQKGRDPQTFVRQTLQAVNWSEPATADIQRWTDRLNQLRGDRFALAREILLGSQPATQVGPGQLGDVGTRLASAARLASESIDFELNGTPQGRQANLQAQSLVDATNQLQQAAVSRVGDVNVALANADRAYQALQSTLSNPPGTAPSSSAVVRRIGTMLADARGGSGGGYPAGGYGAGGNASGGYGAGRYNAGGYGAGGYAPPLGGNPIGTPGSAGLPIGGNAYPYGGPQQQWLDQIAAARRAADSLIQTLTSQSYQDYSYNVVLRDLDTLASRLASLDPLVRSGATRDRVAPEVQSLGDSMERIRSQLSTGRLPYAAQLYWQSLDSSLAQLRDSVGVAAPLAGSTTLMRPSSLHENLLPLLDQAAAQIDVFLAGVSPLVYSVPDVPSIQADMRSLKNRILYMRQQAGGGQPASALKQSLAGMIVDYQDAFNRWNQDVASRAVATPARLSSVGESLNRVEQLINQSLVSGDLSPQGPTRVSQDLAQLSGEVNDARRGLAAFAGYQQQQSIELYLEQLASYVQQLNTAITQPTSLDARRLAVGMQGVIGRMQTDATSLAQQSAAGYAPAVQQQTSDLQLRISRIGRLVDDVESQLY
ncbi:MAG TPA: hypothetical protein VGI40_23260 [Pirellulaceae bacterium]